MDTNPGPVDGSVLYDQDKHVSSAVWEGQERGALRCHEHTSKLGEWKLTPKQIELVERAGFGYLRKIPAISLDNPLISALVERWRRETNTFHFTVGEMTVTLRDVAFLLGLSIDGKPVIGVTYTTCATVCEKLLGRAPDSNYASGGMVKLSWLKEFFSQCSDDAPIVDIERCTRAYLLYLVGSTIFSTTTGNKVPVMYLPLFESFEEAGTYAWGAAALAFLYRALGNACVKSQSTICGCLTLLQCWGYFHLNVGRPKLNRDPIHEHFPFVLRWKGKQSGPTTNRDVVFYRKALDSLKPSDVEWVPYKVMNNAVIPKDIRNTLRLGRSKTMLICFDKAERHLPDRCLRQYGLHQSIPEDVEPWLRKSRGVDGGVDLCGKMESELNEWLGRQNHVVEGDYGVDENEYMQWYSRITRKVVGRPISLSSEFQRTISGLKEIAYLADSFSTKGLDGQQFESISRIRFIAQDCLRDQAASPVTPAPLQIESGKRIRGKEKVRRKGTGKRRKKDELVEYHEASEDDQPHIYGALIETGQLQLHDADDHLDHMQLCQIGNEVEEMQLSHTAVEHYAAEIQDVVNKGGVAMPSEAHQDINDSQHCCPSEINDSHLSDASCKKVDESQLHNPIHDSNHTHLCQTTTSEIHDSGSHHVTSEVNDLLPINAEDNSFCGPRSRGTDNETNEPELLGQTTQDSQLPDITESSNDTQLPNATEEATGTVLSDASKEINGATKETNDSETSHAVKETNNSGDPDVTKTANNSELLDSTKAENNLMLPDAISDANVSSLSVVSEAKLLQPSDATKEVSVSKFSGTENESDPRLDKSEIHDILVSSLETIGDVAKQNDESILA